MMLVSAKQLFSLERSQSWYERYKMKIGDKSISDEHMKKVIGMDKKELADWSKDRPGVGAKQEALYAGNQQWAGADGS